MHEGENDAGGEWLEKIALDCRRALLGYRMSSNLEEKTLTPNAALLKFKGSDDLTVALVNRRLPELESTHGIRVLQVRSEPGRVVIVVKRPIRQTLTLPQVWRSWLPERATSNERILIAVREDDGQPLYLEPKPSPHTLVAGATGSGKSVLIQNILLGIAATNHPDRAKIILIDAKSGVDYFAFDTLPHLDGGIIDDSEVAAQKLDALVAEMERRYRMFKEARVSNLQSYNEQASELLPTIWMVHDEFADWMQIDSYRDAVESVVSRLGVKARAAGIYLIFAAQRPDNTVFPLQLRSNLGNRLILQVDSAGTSEIALGIKNGGAERLLGKGHLAALVGGASEPIYAQVPYIDSAMLEKMVALICEDLANP